MRSAGGKRDHLPPRDIGIAKRAAWPATNVKRQVGWVIQGCLGFSSWAGSGNAALASGSPQRGSRQTNGGLRGAKAGPPLPADTWTPRWRSRNEGLRDQVGWSLSPRFLFARAKGPRDRGKRHDAVLRAHSSIGLFPCSLLPLFPSVVRKRARLAAPMVCDPPRMGSFSGCAAR